MSLFVHEAEHLHGLLELAVGAVGPLAVGKGLTPALTEGRGGNAYEKRKREKEKISVDENEKKEESARKLNEKLSE